MGRNDRRGNRGRFGNQGRRNDRNFEGRRDNNKTQWHTSERLSEAEAGIAQFISSAEGFTGVIKSRYSDFHVNEVDAEGTVTVLSEFSLPEPPVEISEESEEEKFSKLLELISEEQLKQVKELAAGKSDKIHNVDIDCTDFDKDKRAQLHKSLKSAFGKAIFGTTVDKEDKKFIQVQRSTQKDQQRALGWTWPHEFTHFILYKENIDTLQAIAALSHRLKTKPALFAYAGTKDKRAKTSQWISIRKVEPKKICQAARNCQGVRVGNFKFLPDPLKLGSLKGNRFRIALRSVKGELETIEKALTSLKDFGFINYYGLQRFGNCVKVPTYMIGKALLVEDFKGACELVLQEREGEPNYMQKMRKCYAETKDPEKALEMIHSTNPSVEARLLHGLKKHGSTNFLQALLNIPRNMLMLYTHAYQSFIWNQVASKRRELGLEILEGDLVFTEKNEPEVVEVAEEEIADPVDDETAEQEPQEEPEKESKFLAMVRPLTAEDVASGSFTIYDIVLPLPGHDIKYPTNAMGEIYKELLAKDNLESEKLKNKHPVFSLNGAYRKVFGKPENFSWKFLKYSGQTADLIISDYSKIMKDPDPTDDPNGENLALILDFALSPSSYATMALREVMKCDTSVGHHIQMENDNRKAEELKDTAEKRPLNDEAVEEETEIKKIKI